MDLTFDAVIVAGGRASRLGGIDKTALIVGRLSLLEHAVAASDGAERVVVVSGRAGSVIPVGVLSAQEAPLFSGPASALAAGVAKLERDREAGRAREPGWTLVLAADLPRAEEAVTVLRHAAASAMGHGGLDGLVAVDDSGRRQPLLALYRTSSLAEAIREHERADDLDGLSLGRLLAPFRLIEVPMATALCADVDSPDDARRLGATALTPVENARGASAAAD